MKSQLFSMILPAAAGTQKFAIAWVGAHATFPQYRDREDQISTLE
jgi:thiosulfate dehydrogenase